MRALDLVGFRPEHWGYDWPDCYAEFEDKLRYIADAPDEPNSILLAGVVGTGKTAMLAVLCKSIYEHWHETGPVEPQDMIVDYFAKDVKYCTHSELANIWSNEFNDSSDLPTEDYFKKAPILFLDDLGAAPINQSGRNMAKLEELIDWRWSNRMKTFIASNISLKDFWKPQNSQWHRIARRLSEPNWMFYQQLTHKFNVDKLK